VAQLRTAGVRVDRCLPTGVHLSRANAPYLAAKAGRGRHWLGDRVRPSR
jgi:GTP cyclohydrolase II